MTSEVSKPAGSAKTKTLPDEQRGYVFTGPDPVTWLHIAGTVHAYQFPETQQITIGSSTKCDVVVSSRFVSRRHCTLERTYEGFRVHDHESKNGTAVDQRKLGSPREIQAGESFAAGPLTFLALDDEMHRLYPLLGDVLGWEQVTSFDPPPPAHELTPARMLQIATGADHLLLYGDKGAGQDQLARAIHAISPLRGREVVRSSSLPTDRGAQRDLLARASRTTLVIAIDDDTPAIDETFLAALFSPTYRIRVIAIGAPREATAVFGEHHRLRLASLPPIAFRMHQLERLLDHQLEELGTSLRFAQLKSANQKALIGYGWPGNFDEVAHAATRLAAVAATGRPASLRQAADALGEDRSKVQRWFSNKMGLTLPLS